MQFLHQFFEQQAELHPDNIALICHGEILTYRDMERRANQMARWLKSRGIGDEDLVGLLLLKSADLYISILAILKVGAAYVPIAPDFPAERIDYMLKHANVKLLLTSQTFLQESPSFPCEAIDIEAERSTIIAQSIERCEPLKDPDNACYVIYTSGTTGWPKGVIVSHRSVCNYIRSALKIFDVNAQDRIYQGFSIAFDASIEEIWLAFGSGATLVAGSHHHLLSGAGLVEFLNFHKITVLSTVPTMLAMIENEIPSLRVLILGGETCPQDFVTRWARPGLRMFNTYGPTEATIISTYLECDPTQLITIGKPIPNCDIVILNENLEPAASGEYGELCIGGVGLARGYINNDELTQKKFIAHPLKPGERLYRSGDRACFAENGNIKLSGRLDDQIKLRGFRIELPEIESVLLQYPGVRNAVVAVCELVPGVQSLVAYMMLRFDTHLDPQKMTEFLSLRLPDYMIPTLFETMDELPMLSSGKVDRKNLPKPTVQQDIIKDDYVAPSSSLEIKITKTWEELFKHAPISIRADFFHQLGGHSLSAAKVVSLLRKHAEMRQLSTLDLYENPTIEKLAERVTEINLRVEKPAAAHSERGQSQASKSHRQYYLCGLWQALGIFFQYALASWQFVFIFLTLTWAIATTGVLSVRFFSLVLFMLLGLEPALFVIAILSKWLLLGRIKPGKYRLWGWFYFRWWLVQQLQGLTSADYLIGSPLINIYYRLLGVKIGKNCHIGTAYINAFDVVSIGNDSSIGNEVIAQGYTVDQGWLKIGSIKIGDRCYVGVNSVIEINTSIGDDAKLGEHAMLPEGGVIPDNQSFIGSPARPGKVELPVAMAHAAKSKKHKRDAILFGLLHYVALIYVLFIYVAAATPGVALLDYYCYFHPSFLNCLWAVPLGGVLFVFLICFGTWVSKFIFIGTMKPGLYKTKSIQYVKIWLINRLIDLTLDVSYSLYATMYAASWFRLLGAKIGKRTELSTIECSSPDLLTIGDECFVADGGLVGSGRVYGGYIQLEKVKMGNRSFIGNSALVPLGTELGDACLIGCLSIPPAERKVPANTSWFGSPALLLNNREIFTGFSEKETYIPSWNLWLIRAVIDFLKIVLPPIFSFIVLASEFVMVVFLLRHAGLWGTLLLFGFVDLIITSGINLIIIAMKWLLLGRYVETARPAWSRYVIINELISGLYDAVATDLLLSLLGTPFMGIYLRLLGAKIGRDVYIDTVFFSEYDLVDIGDGVSLNSESTIQTHLFEDRIMKMARLKIEDGCTVGSRAIVLYDTIMEKYAYLGSLSLLMKGEVLPAYSHWSGVPAQHSSSTIF